MATAIRTCKRWRRPRVLILGGGFAGIGAAREPEDADADVVLVDQHDYHTFQPLLYQVATTCSSTARSAHPLRDLFHDQPNAWCTRPRSPASTSSAARCSSTRWRRSATTTSSSRSAPRSTSSASTGAPEHAFPLYTLADAMRLRSTCSSAGRRPTGTRPGRRRRAQRRRGRRRADRGRERRRARRALPPDFAEDYPGIAAGQGAAHPGGGGARAVLRCSSRTSARTRRSALEKRGVEVLLGEVGRLGQPDARHAQVRHRAQRAHARLGRRAPGHPLVASLGRRARSAATACRRARPEHRGPSRGVRGRRHRLDHRAKTKQVLPQLGSVALQAGEQPGRTSPGAWRARPQPFAYHDKGTMATIGRGAAVVQLPGGRTMKGKSAFARLGRRAPRAALDRRGPREGHHGLDVGRLHPRAPPGRITRRRPTRRAGAEEQ